MKSFQPNNSSINKIHDAILLSIWLLIFGFTGLCLTFLLLDSSGITSLVVFLPGTLPFIPVKLICILFHMYLAVVVIVACNVLTVYAFTYSFYVTIFYTVELRIGLRASRYRACASLREKFENISHVYRAFQVLNKNALCLTGPMILILHGTSMYMVCFCIVVLLKYWDVLEPIAKAPVIMGPGLELLAWTFVLEFGRTLFSKGTKVINSWSNQSWANGREKKCMKKFQKSCKPLVLAYGTSFVIKKLTMPNFYKGISRGTMRILLAIR